MLSVPDLAIIGALALIFFGPEQLPRVARRVGHVVRDVQNTSQAFIREMERAADEQDRYDEAEGEAGDVTHDTASPKGEPRGASGRSPDAG